MQHRFLLIFAGISLFMIGLFVGRHRLLEPNAPSVKSDVVYSQALKKQNGEPSPSQLSATETAPSLSTADVISGLRNALQESSRRRKSAALSRLVDAVDRTNVREVFDFAQNLPNEQDRYALSSNVLERWAELNPAEAFAFAQTRRAGQERNEATYSVITNWAQSDPNGALAAAQQMPRSSIRESAIEGVLRTIAEKDPRAALTLLQNLSERGYRSSWALSSIFHTWANSDISAAADEAFRISPASMRDTALHAIGDYWASSDPEAGFDWANSI